MLAPETLVFPTRKITEKKKTVKSLSECVNSKGYFDLRPDDVKEVAVVRGLKLVLPQLCENDLKNLKSAFLTDNEHYLASKVSSISAFLLSPEFIKTFLLSGQVFISSFTQNDEIDNSLILRPNGDLVIRIEERLSNKLGLSAAKRHSKGNGQILLRVNIVEQQRSSQKNLAAMQKSLSCLEYIFQEPYTLTWKPHDVSLCPSTIAKFFHDNGAFVEEVEPEIHVLAKNMTSDHILSSLSAINDEYEQLDIDDVDFDAIEDWMGGCFFDIENDRPSTFKRSCDVQNNIHCIDIKGIFLPSSLRAMLETIESIDKTQPKIISICPHSGNLFVPESDGRLSIFRAAHRTFVSHKNAVFARSWKV